MVRAAEISPAGVMNAEQRGAPMTGWADEDGYCG